MIEKQKKKKQKKNKKKHPFRMWGTWTFCPTFLSQAKTLCPGTERHTFVLIPALYWKSIERYRLSERVQVTEKGEISVFNKKFGRPLVLIDEAMMAWELP